MWKCYHDLRLWKLKHCQDQLLSHHCTLPNGNTVLVIYMKDIAENKKELSEVQMLVLVIVKFIMLNFHIKWLVYFMSAFNLFEAAKSSFLPESGLSASESGSSDSLSPECAKRCQKCKWATESSSGGSASLKWNSRFKQQTFSPLNGVITREGEQYIQKLH